MTTCSNCRRDPAMVAVHAQTCSKCEKKFCELCGFKKNEYVLVPGDHVGMPPVDPIKFPHGYDWRCWICEGLPQAAAYQRSTASDERYQRRQQ